MGERVSPPLEQGLRGTFLVFFLSINPYILTFKWDDQLTI